MVLSVCGTSCSQTGSQPSGEVTLSLETENAGYKADGRFVYVGAPGEWSLSLVPVTEGDDISWASLSRTSGSGSAAVVLSYEYNGEETPRSLNVRLVSGSTTLTCGFVQKGISYEPEKPEKAPAWMELPEMTSSVTYYNHSFRYDGDSYRNYSFGWSAPNRLAFWVAYPLCGFYTAKKVGRVDAWNFDPDVPVSQQANLTRSYSGSYDRGHQLPSADRLVCSEANMQTFYFTNMTPQSSSLNQGLWGNIEGSVRGWSDKCDTVYVVTGCIMSDNPSVTSDAAGNKCPIPSAYFKGVLRYSRSGTQGWGGYTGIGIYVEHFKNYKSQNLSREMVMSLSELEKRIGYKLFVNLSDKIGEENAVKVKSQNPLDVGFWGL